jgi:hypothetical protein
VTFVLRVLVSSPNGGCLAVSKHFGFFAMFFTGLFTGFLVVVDLLIGFSLLMLLTSSSKA